jgi:ParB-like chromosome segregation protein Spo0J
MIDNGKVASRAELARRLGVSRARVTQMLQLLTLSPNIIDAIVQLGDPLPTPTVTERNLRPLARLDQRQQIRRFKRLCAVRQTSERSGTSV